MAEFDTSDGEDALVALRAIGEDEPLVDPNADTFELDLGAGRRVVIPMDRGAQRRGVAGASGTEAASETGAVVWDGPFYAPAEADEAQVAALCADWSARLSAATRKAEVLVGAPADQQDGA